MIKEKNHRISGFKIVKWFNANTKEINYGINAMVNRKWLNLKEGDDPLIFSTEREAAKKIKELCKAEGFL